VPEGRRRGGQAVAHAPEQTEVGVSVVW
jgi:hypothetical protein